MRIHPTTDAPKGRHADKIGRWVTIDGVRDHYRGLLVGVVELGAGEALLRFSSLYWLQSLESPNGEFRVHCSAENPAELYSGVVGLVSLQPAGWPGE